eukprot:1707952-Prymnesium_polylepis.1
MRACDNPTTDVLWCQGVRGVRHRARHHGCALRIRTNERGNNGMVLWRGAVQAHTQSQMQRSCACVIDA